VSKGSLFHQVLISNATESIRPANEDNIKEYFPNHTHIVWDASAVKRLMLKNNDGKVAEAFDKVNPYSYKADLAKYYLVYCHGGWYSDLNNFFVAAPPDLTKVDLLLFRDLGQGHETGTWSATPGLFYAKPRNPILKSAFIKCVYHIEQEYYGPHPLYVTGPPVLGLAAAEEYALAYQKSYVGNYIWDENKDVRGFYFGNKKFASYKPNIEAVRQAPVAGGNDYESMWYARRVYN
jgi:mannosyltransferase OCH1-like enzyme